MKDKNKIIVFIIVIAIFFIGLFLYATPGKNVNKETNTDDSTKSPPAITGDKTTNTLTAPEMSYDFGTISMKDGNVSKIFKVTNPTNENIKVSSVTTSCMCTVAYIVREDGSKSRPFGMPGHGGAVPKANEIIKAGGSFDLEVVYDPNAHGPAGVGFIERSVFLEDENNNVIEFKFKVNVTP